MATTIRLTRRGSKKHPFYRIIVTDSRNPRDGRFIKQLGTYNPETNPIEIKFDNEKTSKWLGTGATMSDTVRSLYKKWQKEAE